MKLQRRAVVRLRKDGLEEEHECFWLDPVRLLLDGLLPACLQESLLPPASDKRLVEEAEAAIEALKSELEVWIVGSTCRTDATGVGQSRISEKACIASDIGYIS